MEIVLIFVSISTFFFFFLIAKRRNKCSLELPPGPFALPVIGNIIWPLPKSLLELEQILRRLHAKHGPIVALRFGLHVAVSVADRSLAHRALVHHGAAFASRPPALSAAGNLNISASPYGATWRLLRRNLTSHILHPSHFSAFSPARRWALSRLLRRLRPETAVDVTEHFHYAVFCLLTRMCFGDDVDQADVENVEAVQRRLFLSVGRYNVLGFWPSLTKILFYRRWKEFLRLRRDQEAVLVPLINSRRTKPSPTSDAPCYVDTLLNLNVPSDSGGGADRKLGLTEVVGLCSEFLNASTDTTSTALQWIMANLVKHPEIQERLYAEIKAVTAASGDDSSGAVSEEEVGKMRYLKAVVVEGLRRHPPSHFVVPHAVTEDVELGGFLIPNKCSVNFMVAEIGWDPNVWDDPMAFNPERFLEDDGEEVDNVLRNSGETIKMMPFGVGRRICPAVDLALLHLQYFVGNLVWKFRWSADPDNPVDLSETQEFSVVMKSPLRARLTPRTAST